MTLVYYSNNTFSLILINDKCKTSENFLSENCISIIKYNWHDMNKLLIVTFLFRFSRINWNKRPIRLRNCCVNCLQMNSLVQLSSSPSSSFSPQLNIHSLFCLATCALLTLDWHADRNVSLSLVLLTLCTFTQWKLLDICWSASKLV